MSVHTHGVYRFSSMAFMVIFLLSLPTQATAADLLSIVVKHADDLVYYSGRHLQWVVLSMLAALLIGVSAGVTLSRPVMVHWVGSLMQLFNLGNTVPSIAVLAIALVLFGIGNVPTMVALTLVSMLPIVRNTYEGLCSVPLPIRESARGVGMKPWQCLMQVELPYATPILIGGVRTALAINVGTAPLATLIGGDSLGSLIFPGIYLNDMSLLLLGASATALMALLLDLLISMFAAGYLQRQSGPLLRQEDKHASL
jgi:osmoprotectant transport system permease protein